MTTPAGWYPDPNGTQQQRYFDGAQWTTHYAPNAPYVSPHTPTNRRAVVAVLGIIGAVVVLGMIGNAVSDKDKPRSRTSSSFVAPLAPAGSSVRDGELEFQVLDMTRSGVAGKPGNQYMREFAQGEFIVLQVSVGNIGNKPQAFFGANQKLIDTAGREYAANSSVDMWLNGYVGDINPGNAVRVTMAFDVPPGTVADALEVHDSMFSGGTRVGIADPRK